MARVSTRLRLGAAALGVCALLFAAFPFVRPFFRLDVFSPTLAAVASGPLASTSWVAAHLLLVVAFALLPRGLLAIHAALADNPAEPQALRGWSSVWPGPHWSDLRSAWRLSRCP